MAATSREDVVAPGTVYTAAGLNDVLAAVVPVLRDVCRDSWTLIGSAAAWLAGARVTIADLDVLTSTRDAEVLADHWREHRDGMYVPANGERFRSRFTRFRFSGLPVEVMGGLELFGENGWELVRIGEIVMVDAGGLAVPIPAVAEQVRVLESFGRPKDRQRAAQLKLLCGNAE
jgi:hypothetical protein